MQKNRRTFLGSVLAGGTLASTSHSSDTSTTPHRQGLFNVVDFGATATGKALETKALQAAIDAAGQSGGAVYFPPGTYLSGTLRMRSHVSLRLEAGAVLLGSKDLTDYPHLEPAIRSYTDNYANQFLIYGANLEDVSLAGGGTIDGQGASFQRLQDYGNRPYLIRFVNCRRVRVEGLTLLDPPMWLQHYLACQDVSLHGLTIHSRSNANNDGIDLDACDGAHVSDCVISSLDDSVTLKSTIGRPCRDVTVTNCVISTDCNAIKLGTESVGGFQNITVTNCAVHDTKLAGIALECVDGGLLENVNVSHIVMRNVSAAIFLRLGNRARPPYDGAPAPGMGSYRNVMISDVQAVGVGKVGCSITGLSERPMENVTLSNIRLRFLGGGTAADSARKVEELPRSYPEFSMFGVLPAYGFYCRHVRNLRLLHTDVSFEREDSRPALVCEDVTGLHVADFAAANSNPVMVWRDTRDAWLEASHAPHGNNVYLRVEGEKAENVCVAANDLRASRKPVELGPGARADSVLLAAPFQPMQSA